MELISSLFLVLLAVIPSCNGKPLLDFPAILIFGDSTADTGNNNYLQTQFKANHYPYGRDFPGQVPTGRFSNGKLVPDLVAFAIGLKETVPPFLQPDLSDEDSLTGVNFASAGSGYDELTTEISGAIPMSRQLSLFKEYKERLTKIVGEKKAERIVGEALVIISAGTNDFIFNYYDIPTRKFQFSISEYHDFVQNKLRNFIKELYDLGCHKMLVAGLPPIGCLPIQLSLKASIFRGCIENENLDAQSYNEKLQNLLEEMPARLPGSKILYADTYTYFMDMINNPPKYGFVETTKGCCGTGLLEAGPLCSAVTPVCANPSQYLFWDSIHPSEATYRFLAEQLMKALLANKTW